MKKRQMTESTHSLLKTIQAHQLEALLSFRDSYTNFTTRELWETGSLGNHPGEYLMMVASELFPIRTSSDIKKRNMLVAKAIEELNK
jgi:hypothetical protein